MLLLLLLLSLLHHLVVLHDLREIVLVACFLSSVAMILNAAEGCDSVASEHWPSESALGPPVVVHIVII